MVSTNTYIRIFQHRKKLLGECIQELNPLFYRAQVYLSPLTSASEIQVKPSGFPSQTFQAPWEQKLAPETRHSDDVQRCVPTPGHRDRAVELQGSPSRARTMLLLPPSWSQPGPKPCGSRGSSWSNIPSAKTKPGTPRLQCSSHAPHAHTTGLLQGAAPQGL